MRKGSRSGLVFVAAAGLAGFILAWESSQAVKLGYRIESLRREIRDLETSNKYLDKEIRETLSPKRLEAEAARLGMVYPEPDSIVMMDNMPGDGSGRGWLARLFQREDRS